MLPYDRNALKHQSSSARFSCAQSQSVLSTPAARVEQQSDDQC
jgi:hypothetical protein